MRNFFLLSTFLSYSTLFGQVQDSTLNNLIHTPEYRTGTWGELGEVKKFGSGPVDMILLPGWGFDQSIFGDFIKRHEKQYRIFAVTFPGFGNTQAPPMPATKESYGGLYWTKGILKGLSDLIDEEKIKNPVLVSCFTYSEMIALRMALDFPDKIGKVIILGGMAKFTLPYPSYEPRSLTKRTAYIDNVLSQYWFKTVTKQTWDNGNFAPGTFTRDSVTARRHWNMMSSVPIPVMVRYLCEYYSTDISLEYKDLTVPVLVVIPAFTYPFLSDSRHAYITPFFHGSWLGALPANEKIQMTTLTDTHAFIMDDQPEKLDKLIEEFVSGKYKPAPQR